MHYIARQQKILLHLFCFWVPSVVSAHPRRLCNAVARDRWNVKTLEGLKVGEESDERFLSAQADAFAGANAKKKSACCVRNDGVAGVDAGYE